MQNGKMKRIIIHWTAGYCNPTEFEKEHYHYLVDSFGKIHKGKYSPEDNINCQDGKYAQHTGGGNTGCYDKDTEVLTNNGWKYFEDVDINKDLFLTMDEEQNPEYQNATEFFKYDIDDELINFTNKSCNLMVTKNHNMVLLSEKTSKNYFRKAEDIEKYSSVSFPMNKTIIGSDIKSFKIDEYEIPIKLWCQFIGIYLSEGCCDKAGNKNNHGNERYKVSITQVKSVNPDKWEVIKSMLDNVPWRYNIEGDNFVINNKALCLYLRRFGYCYDKYIPEELKHLSKDLTNVIWYWLLMGDGCYGSGNTEHYYTSSIKLRDDIQEMMALHGYRTVCHTIYPKDVYINGRLVKKENQKIIYDITRLRRNNTYLENNFSKRVSYKGYVYCVTVPNHTLLTRRNGKVQWSGNSIGVSMCGMANFKNRDNIGDCPLTKIQVEATCKLCAELAHKYGIEVNPQTTMTHYEFGQKNPKTTSYGKIDIVFLPPFSHVAKDDVGDFLRSKIRWYLKYAS